MTPKRITWSRCYEAALQRHLTARSDGSAGSARLLGRQATTLGLTAMDVARIHERTLGCLESGQQAGPLSSKAERFLARTIDPMKQKPGSLLESTKRVRLLEKALDLRTRALAGAHRSLQRIAARRKTAEAAAAKRHTSQAKLLQESLRLSDDLRQMMHTTLINQEKVRRIVSIELQNEIVQSLLGIQVHLTSMNREARNTVAGVKIGIAHTQRLVAKSARSLRRAAHDLGTA